ncbi:lamin tail domain-containing protein, partial [Patescibacteria group bacterium]|nr:lamin tail domain-containing protein [Patescibacteria group bacterium]
HSDYYSLLAPKAISYGAGVIDLFFQEAEKERQKNLEKSWLEKLKEKIFSSPQAAGPGFVLNLEPEKPKEAEEQKPLEPEPIPDIGSTAHEPQVSRSPALQIDGTPTPSQTPLPTPTLPPKSQDAQDLVARMVVSNAPPYPGFGGGGGAEIKSEAQNPTPNQEQSSGAGQESETNFNDQNSNIQTQENQQQLEQPEQLEPQDTTPPDVLLSAADCLNTDASSICLMATTTLNIFWSSSAEDLDYFEFTISNEAITSTTTATSTIVFIENNSSNIFSVRAVDTYGNWSEPQTITVVIYSMPVVINEVAWMGTPASGSDEWIELYNRTDYEIDLNNWILYSETDLKPYINLSGIIPAKGYYLIERTDDNTVLGITADWKGSFGSTQGGGSGLDNGGENLILSYASTTIDEVPYCYKWCGGISNNENYRYSMERYAPDVPGSDLSNWGTNIGLIKNGKNVLDIPINGTPKARNSVNYLIAKGAPSISSDIILTKTNSPYLVAGMNNDGMIQVFQDSSSLTIEPGVVIKFYNDSGMIIGANAKIIAQGAANDQIIFTAFADDEYGGDVNNNGFSTSTPGAWFGVRIESNNEDSVFEHAVFRYGGKYYDGGTWVDSKANLCVWETPIFASNSLFEYAIGCGLKLSNSTSTLSSNIFQNNGLYGEACGIYINN